MPFKPNDPRNKELGRKGGLKGGKQGIKYFATLSKDDLQKISKKGNAQSILKRAKTKD